MHTNPLLAPEEGTLLLASPLICDGIFDRSVILITNRNPKIGMRGFILNKILNHTVSEVSDDPNIPIILQNIQVGYGGPVETEHIFFIAFSNTKGEFSYNVGLSIDEAADFCNKRNTIVRAYTGFASWNPEQIEAEFNEFTWIQSPVNDSLLGYEQNENMWKKLLEEISPRHAILAQASKRPFLN